MCAQFIWIRCFALLEFLIQTQIAICPLLSIRCKEQQKYQRQWIKASFALYIFLERLIKNGKWGEWKEMLFCADERVPLATTRVCFHWGQVRSLASSEGGFLRQIFSSISYLKSKECPLKRDSGRDLKRTFIFPYNIRWH